MLRTLLLIPSFYGATLFAVAFALYSGNSGEYEQPSSEIYLICLGVVLAFTLATVRSFPRFAACGRLLLTQQTRRNRSAWTLVAALHLIGLLGIYQYFTSLVGYFGSPLDVVVRLVSNSADIRAAVPDISSIGIQISYAGWIAIWLTVLSKSVGKEQWILIGLAVIQLAGNLLFIDRTRPTWILFVVVLLFALKHFSLLRTRLLAFVITCTGVGFISLFVLIGAWVGKVDVSAGAGEVSERVQTALEPVYFYATSGFAYFNRVLLLETPDMTLARSLYPLWTVGAHFGVVDPPPSQINEFISTPKPTNVGTFLEPLYRDGGLALLVAGVALHAFGFNWIAVRMLRRQSSLCSMAWAVLCFTDAIAFFTPKYASAPVWLFVGLGLAPLAWSRQKLSPMSNSDVLEYRRSK